jgi:hypothetical protein
MTVSQDDTLVVDNGSWQTVTTLARLNDWLPSGWGIYTHKGTGTGRITVTATRN